MYVSVLISSSHNDISHMGLEPTLWPQIPWAWTCSINSSWAFSSPADFKLASPASAQANSLKWISLYAISLFLHRILMNSGFHRNLNSRFYLESISSLFSCTPRCKWAKFFSELIIFLIISYQVKLITPVTLLNTLLHKLPAPIKFPATWHWDHFLLAISPIITFLLG